MDLSTILRAARLKPAGARPVMLMDFDGTLVALADDPDLVELSDATREALRRLARRDDVTAGVISGRRLDDLRSRVGVGDAVYYAGLHGLEIEGPGMQFLHSQAAHTRPLIQQIGRSLVNATKGLAGVRIENKELTLALHVRGSDPTTQRDAEGVLREIVDPHLRIGTLRLLCGADVFELLPAVAWTKGDAVLHIKAAVERRYGQPAWLIYLGDDVTDEDAFRAVAATGVAIAVGDRPASTAFRLATPDAVERFLREVAQGFASD